MGLTSTTGLATVLVAGADGLGSIGLIRLGVPFLMSLAWTSCLGVASIVCRATETVSGAFAAGMVLQKASDDQDAVAERQRTLRIVAPQRR